MNRVPLLPGQGDLPLAVKRDQRGVGVLFCAITRLQLPWWVMPFLYGDCVHM
jgi:hypothetical protein